jgi:hypothetical protein
MHSYGNPSPISDCDLDSAINALFNLYAGICIVLQKYKFGSSNEMKSLFISDY